MTLIYFLLFYLAQKLKTGQALLGENAHFIDTGPRGGGEANLYPGVLGAQAVWTHPRLARAWAGAARPSETEQSVATRGPGRPDAWGSPRAVPGGPRVPLGGRPSAGSLQAP